LAVARHYSLNGIPFKSKQVISIDLEEDDSLLFTLLCYSRAGDYQFDLKNFNVNFYNQVKNTKFQQAIEDITKYYDIDVKALNTIPRGILREYYKFGFRDYSKNYLIKATKNQKYDFPVFRYYMRDLYDFDLFIKSLYNIQKFFKIEYELDIDWYRSIWEQFMSGIVQLDQENYANSILSDILNNKHTEIDFNLIQESWLNGRLEKLYSIEMPVHMEEYFKSTSDVIEYLQK